MKLTKVIALIFFTVPFSINAETCGGFDGLTCCNAVVSTDSGVCVIPASTKYAFTLKRFGFQKADGTITWVGSEATFNAASATIGAEMGAFVSGSALPIGTYVAVRPEVKMEMTVNGASGTTYDTTDDVTCTTGGDKTESLADVMTSLGETIPSCDSSPNANCDIGNGYQRIYDNSLGDITITASSAPTITFKFDVGSGVVFTTGSGCVYKSMGPLDASMSIVN